MNYSRNTLFGDSQQQSTVNNKNGVSKPPSETILEKQLLDKSAVLSRLNFDPFPESLEVIQTRKQVIRAPNLETAELTQVCRKYYEDLCEEYLNLIESETRRNQEFNIQNESAKKTDNNATEKELKASRKMIQFLLDECKKHKKTSEELRKEISLKHLQRVSILETVPGDQEKIVTLRDSLSKEQEINAKPNEDIEALLKRIDVVEAEKRRIDNDKAELITHCERLLKDNQKLNAQVVDLEKLRDMKVKQDLEAAKRFFKQIDGVVDENIFRLINKVNRLKEENQKTSEQNQQSLLKGLEQEELINELVLKDKEAQENMLRLLVENNNLELSKKYFECKYKRLEDELKKLMRKYNINVDKQEGQATEMSDKEHQAKITNFLKNMDQFKENQMDNQKLSIENHDVRLNMLDIAVRYIMGINIKTDNAYSVSQ